MRNKKTCKVKKEKNPKQDKKSLVYRLVEVPKGARKEFLIAEYSVLNKLLEIYSFDFLAQVVFEHKLPSLKVLFSDYYKDLLERKLVSWRYQSDYSGFKPVELKTEPVEELITIQRTKTLKDFLNE